MFVPVTFGRSDLSTLAKPEFAAVRKTKVYEKVSQQIQRMIVDGLLKPGDMLPPERVLAETFQVSRSSLRDAIRSLELIGLVEPRLTTESLVNPIAAMLVHKREMLLELLELRRMIEPPLAGRAAIEATSEEIAFLEDILARQKAKVDRGELAVEEDTEFHYAIAEAARNSVVLKVVDVFMDLLRESRERSLQGEGRLQKSFEGHRRILNAIRRHNATAAQIAMRRHIQEIEAVVLKKI
jgi:GntR family transcriptional repressor for pyruvate dehydrogenase complex